MRLEINMQEFVKLVTDYFDENEIKNIMEIGSLNGNDALFFKKTFPNANVFCIEGLPENYDTYLKDLTEITPINIVIANYDGEIVFHKKNINGLHGILNRGDEYGSETITLKCKTMQTLCDEYNITTLDLVKIDVEGATYQILESMENMLKTIKIMHIETESYPFFQGQILDDEVVNFLTKNNFMLIDKTSVTINIGQQHDSVWICRFRYIYLPSLVPTLINHAKTF
jgi:FkbM family methyltransferase